MPDVRRIGPYGSPTSAHEALAGAEETRLALTLKAPLGSHDESEVPPPLRNHGGLISLALVPVGVLVCSLLTYFFPKIGLILFGLFFAACGMARLSFYRRNNCSHPHMLIVRRPLLDISILFAVAAVLVILPFSLPGW